MPKNILIIGHSNIGDACYDLVVVKPLRAKFPGARISFLTSPRCAEIVGHTIGIDQTIVMDKKQTDRGFFGRLPFMFSLRRERFDLTIVLVNTLMHKFLGIPRAWVLNQFLGEKVPKNVHVIETYREFLRVHDVEVKAPAFEFDFGIKQAAFCEAFLKKAGLQSSDRIVGILPLAAWSLKNWPVSHWNRLSEILQKQMGFKVIAFGKSNVNPFEQSVVNHLSRELIWAVDQTNLAQALALIKRCEFFIGPDSGLLHLASCMQIKTIGLYGATSKDFIYPYFHREKMIVSQADIPCMPCYPGNTVCQRVAKSLCGQCMEEISVETVVQALKNYY